MAWHRRHIQVEQRLARSKAVAERAQGGPTSARACREVRLLRTTCLKSNLSLRLARLVPVLHSFGFYGSSCCYGQFRLRDGQLCESLFEMSPGLSLTCCETSQTLLSLRCAEAAKGRRICRAALALALAPAASEAKSHRPGLVVASLVASLFAVATGWNTVLELNLANTRKYANTNPAQVLGSRAGPNFQGAFVFGM